LVRVQTPPHFTSVEPAQVTVSRGANVELPCRATGQPEPLVRWSRADGRLLPASGNNGLSFVETATGTLRYRLIIYSQK
jgi:hypothetical protein